VSRSDEDRIADILEAANEIGAIVARGKQAWDAERISRLAAERLPEMIEESAGSTRTRSG